MKLSDQAAMAAAAPRPRQQRRRIIVDTLTIVNTGTISAVLGVWAAAAATACKENAITFTGGANSLELRAG